MKRLAVLVAVLAASVSVQADTLYVAGPPGSAPGHPMRLGADHRAGQVGDLAINAVPTLGVTASWNVQQQRLVLTSKAGNGQSPFTIQDVPSAGASNTSNFLGTFAIQGQADTINTLSTQLGDIDRVMNNVLKARADVGQRIQSLSSQATIVGGQVTQNTAVQSGYEDTNVAAATSKFTLTQTALQAAYAVTSRLEGKTLLDYLP